MSAPAFATPALIQSIFGEALSKYTSSLLCKVCDDYNLNFEEVSAKYMDSADGMSFFTTSKVQEVTKTPKVPKAPKEEKRPCIGQTTKGQCKFAAMPGSDLCGIHQRKADGVKSEKKPKVDGEEKPKKTPKTKATDPKHTHPLTEESEDCELCSTHGNVMNPELPKQDFEEAEEARAKEAEERAKIVWAKMKAEEPKTEEKPKTSGFIRPPIRKKKVQSPVEAGPSEPKKVPDDSDSIRNKLRMILANAEQESEDEEEDVTARLTAKLSKSFDHESDEEVDLHQMCDSPTSQDRLRGAWADLQEEEEE
jgi:hypothetical protein